VEQAAQPGDGMGKYRGANQADRWRKRMRQGRRWRLSRNGVTWVLIVLAIAIFSTLIALKALAAPGMA